MPEAQEITQKITTFETTSFGTTSMDAIFENIHVQSTINGSTFENHTCPAIWLSGEQPWWILMDFLMDSAGYKKMMPCKRVLGVKYFQEIGDGVSKSWTNSKFVPENRPKHPNVFASSIFVGVSSFFLAVSCLLKSEISQIFISLPC